MGGSLPYGPVGSRVRRVRRHRRGSDLRGAPRQAEGRGRGGRTRRAPPRRLYAHRGKTRRRLSEGIAKRGKDTGGQRGIGAPPDRKNLRSTPPLQCGLLASSATSIPRRQAIVNDDMLLLHVDVAAGGEVLQYPRHHLARGADTVGNVLLRELALDHEAIALRRRHAEQGLRNTAVDVEQRQALHVVGEGAHAVREVFDEDGVLGITAYLGVTGDLGDLGLVQTGKERNVF